MVAFFLLTSLIMGLTACASTNKQSNSNNAKKEEVITLELWQIWATDADPNKKPMEKVLKSWNDSNENIQIKADPIASESYKTKIKTAIAANEAPDIFFTWGAGFSKPFVDSGKVLPLNDYLNDGIKDRLITGTLDTLTYDGKVYGLPFSVAVGTFYCNEELFKKHGLKMPETYDELLEVCKAFREKGITPFTVGEKDRWPGMFYYDVLAMRQGGAKLANNALAGKERFDDPAFVEAANKLSQLVQIEAFNKGAVGLSRDEAEIPFFQGEIPMYYNGSWVASSIEREGSPVKGKVIAKKFPIIKDGQGNENEFLGGVTDTFMINASTEHKDEAVAALKYISENLSRELYLAGILPAWKLEVDESEINPLTRQIKNMVNDATAFMPAWDVFLTGADADTHKDLVQEIFTGTITPEEFGEKMQQINENK